MRPNDYAKIYRRTLEECVNLINSLASSNNLTPYQVDALQHAQRLYDALKHVRQEQKERFTE